MSRVVSSRITDRATVYGFYDECKRRCNIKTWKTFIDVFNCLPIAAIVASKIFCVHGGVYVLIASSETSLTSSVTGLSPSIHSIDQIKVVDRFRGAHYIAPKPYSRRVQPKVSSEIPHEGPMADLVWSDPDPEKEDFAISPRYGTLYIPFRIRRKSDKRCAMPQGSGLHIWIWRRL